jgi:hypothetical protein
MTSEFEYMNYDEDDRITVLENRAAELERRLLAGSHRGRAARWGNVATPAGYPDPAFAEPGYPDELMFAGDADEPQDELAGSPHAARRRTGPRSTASGRPRGGPGGRSGAAPAGGRTQALLEHGRQRSRPGRIARVIARWRLLAVAAAALLAGIVGGLLALGGSSASWPGSVATVRAEITQACANPDTAAEPSGLNFACDKDTQSVLWVFSLLTSGNNAGYVDQGTGRKGLEPIQPAQGGDIAWSLNLHHPYDAGDPVDSLEVAARAINNIISGATLTSSTGSAQVEAGLESKAANCQRYTGSARLVTRAGYPAHCAAAVSGAAGEAALVSDVFKQWMGSTSAALANEAGVLFEHSTDPGNAQVRSILSSLPASGG